MTRHTQNERLHWLIVFGNAARCRYPGPQRKASAAFVELKKTMPEAQLTPLVVAWAHALLDEGPAELDNLLKEMKDACLTG